MKKIIMVVVALLLMFNSPAYAGSQEVIKDFIDFLEEQQRRQAPPVLTPKKDEFNFWEFFKKDTTKERSRQMQEDRLKRANEALNNLHRYAPQK